jgi:hypothetical protein
VSDKLVTYWCVRSADDRTAPPEWEQLPGPLETTAGPYGELAVENDDQRMLVYFEDRSAHERVTRAAKDAAARRESGRFRTSPQHALLTKVTDHKPSEA